MRIGILTGGGDVPGLNPCIKAVVNRVADEGHEVVGIRRGWAALLEHNLDDPASAGKLFLPLDPNVVRTIDRYRRHVSCTPRARTRPRSRPAAMPALLAAPSTRATGRSTSRRTCCG